MDNDAKLYRLRKACEKARLDFKEVLAQCSDGRAQFWDHPQACAVTVIAVSGDHKTCHITAAGGTLEGLRALDEQIVSFARDKDCQVIQAHGRMGFTNPANKDDQGYKPKAVLYEKVL